jgi:hypothetical protein
MMIRRAETPRAAGVTEVGLRRREEGRLVAPNRSWKTLWLVRDYHLFRLEINR